VANDETFALLTVSASAQGIDQLFWMVNPAKLDKIMPAVA
jgi:hypothetical protein